MALVTIYVYPKAWVADMWAGTTLDSHVTGTGGVSCSHVAIYKMGYLGHDVLLFWFTDSEHRKGALQK